jgi:hypothetical protein
LHIRCGDDIRDKLVEAGIEGDYLSVAAPAWPAAGVKRLAGRAVNGGRSRPSRHAAQTRP